MKNLHTLAARAASAGVACHALALVGLHVLEPQLSAASSIISDYSGTGSARLATVAFLVFAGIWASLAVALAAVPSPGRTMTAGRVLFALGALAIVVAAVAPESADPRTGSLLARLQNLLARPGLFLGVVLVSLGLRRAPKWEDIGTSLVALSIFSVVLLLLTLALLLDRGLGGIGQRMVFVLLYVWALLVSVRIVRGP